MSASVLRLVLLAGAVLLVAGLLVAAVVLWRRRQRRRRRLVDLIGRIAGDYQRDVLISDGAEGWYHLDFVLRTSMGLVILDVRDARGAVFGCEHLGEWTAMERGTRQTFPNPLETLYDRIAAVRAVVGDDVPVEGRVVLLARATLATAAPPRTLLLEELATLAEPVAELGDQYAASWAALVAATQPSPPALRRALR